MKILKTRISGPDGPLILAVDLRNTPKGGGYGGSHAPTHCFIYIDTVLQYLVLTFWDSKGKF